MCTAITFNAKDHYFGRTLDLEYSYNETVTVTPRRYPFSFKNGTRLDSHYAFIGMATVSDNYPLYYEATNEKGLSVGGLNFPGNAVYYDPSKEKLNLASFELIPYILSTCATVNEAKKILEKANITDIAFSSEFPLSPLHWIIADKTCAITAESTAAGLKLYDNPVGVLTNNPEFDYHLLHLSTFMNLSPHPAFNLMSNKLNLQSFSRATGALGLPGDCTSQSRFVRASFNKLNGAVFESEEENVNQFFHILSSVEQIKGTVKTEKNKDVITVYTSCCNTQRGIYYYITYLNRSIYAVDLNKEDLDSEQLVTHALRKPKFDFCN